MLKLYKNFTITVSTFDENLIDTCRYSSRLSCEETHYNENPEETDYSDENGNSDEELYYGSQDLDDGFDEDYDLMIISVLTVMEVLEVLEMRVLDNVFLEMFRAMMRDGD